MDTLSPHRHCEEPATKLRSNFALVRRSNPDCLRREILDCFAALAMTEQELTGVAQTHTYELNRRIP
ncbi:hypothetical protein ACVWYH_001259 [Bradyrhizobium sp. GM24.11]